MIQTPPPVWTWPVILTLCLAALAFVMSVVALGWQIISWRRSGPRVKVVRIHGIGGTPDGVWFTGVKAENSGRLGTEVQQFGFQLPNGFTIQSVENFIGQPIQLPMPLAPGGEASAMYNAAAVQHAMNQIGNDGAGARPFVQTGHGRFDGKPVNLGEEVDLMLRAGAKEQSGRHPSG